MARLSRHALQARCIGASERSSDVSVSRVCVVRFSFTYHIVHHFSFTSPLGVLSGLVRICELCV